MNDSAPVSLFRSADMATRPDLATIWQRTFQNPKNFPADSKTVDKLLVENPFIVLFGSKISFSASLENYPCLIHASSNVLGSVSQSFYFKIKTFFCSSYKFGNFVLTFNLEMLKLTHNFVLEQK